MRRTKRSCFQLKKTFSVHFQINLLSVRVLKFPASSQILSSYNSHRNLITEPLGQVSKSSRAEAFFKNMLFRTLQKSQEKTCIEVFFIKLQDFRYSLLVFRKGPFQRVWIMLVMQMILRLIIVDRISKEVLEKLEPNLNNFMVPTIRSYRKFRQRPFFSVDVKTNKYSYKLQFLTLVPLMNSLEQLE